MGLPVGYVPQFIQPSELAAYGLPQPSQQPDIMAVVQFASTLIDEFCARTDVDGAGSLVYTTYQERLLLPVGRNIVRLTFRPLAAVAASVQQQIATSGGQLVPNWVWTGFQANGTMSVPTATLSPIIACSGRYGYARRGQQQVYPDLNYAANILQIASFFGGPPQFTNIDVGSIDFDPRTGEVWLPAGLYLSQYTEIWVTYNAGFHPLYLPPTIKRSTAALARNLLSRGGGATGLKSFQAGRIRAEFDDDLIDVNLQNALQAYRTVRAL